MSTNRPGGTFGTVTTPAAKEMIELLGSGYRHENITLTQDEMKHLRHLYGFPLEPSNARPPKPVQKPYPPNALSWDRNILDREYKQEVAAWEKWVDPQGWLQSGSDRNLFRHAAADGLRMVAWLAQYAPKGEDPLKTLIQMAIDSGYDVTPSDVTYSGEELPDPL